MRKNEARETKRNREGGRKADGETATKKNTERAREGKSGRRARGRGLITAQQ